MVTLTAVLRAANVIEQRVGRDVVCRLLCDTQFNFLTAWVIANGPPAGAYLRMLEVLLLPELIIGGGVSAKSEKFFKYAKCRAPKVMATAFNAAGMVGAALWAVDQKRFFQAAAPAPCLQIS